MDEGYWMQNFVAKLHIAWFVISLKNIPHSLSHSPKFAEVYRQVLAAFFHQICNQNDSSAGPKCLNLKHIVCKAACLHSSIIESHCDNYQPNMLNCIFMFMFIFWILLIHFLILQVSSSALLNHISDVLYLHCNHFN